jgi:hypothetical protein
VIELRLALGKRRKDADAEHEPVHQHIHHDTEADDGEPEDWENGVHQN